VLQEGLTKAFSHSNGMFFGSFLSQSAFKTHQKQNIINILNINFTKQNKHNKPTNNIYLSYFHIKTALFNNNILPENLTESTHAVLLPV